MDYGRRKSASPSKNQVTFMKEITNQYMKSIGQERNAGLRRPYMFKDYQSMQYMHDPPVKWLGGIPPQPIPPTMSIGDIRYFVPIVTYFILYPIECLFHDSHNWKATEYGLTGTSVPSTGDTAIFEGRFTVLQTSNNLNHVMIKQPVLCFFQDNGGNNGLAITLLDGGSLTLTSDITSFGRIDVETNGYLNSNGFGIKLVGNFSGGGYLNLSKGTAILNNSTITLEDQLYVSSSCDVDLSETTFILIGGFTWEDEGFTYGSVSIQNYVSTGTLYNTIKGNPTVGNLSVTGDGVLQFWVVSSPQTITVTNDLTLEGTTTGGLDIYNDPSYGKAVTFSKSSGTVTAKNCKLTNITASGGATFNALVSDGNEDGGGSDGWDFGVAPTVTTQAASSVGDTSFTGNGNITSTGSPYVSRRGFCYKEGTTGDPTTSDSVAYNDGSFGSGAFNKSVTGLTAETDYRVRAYAVNSYGTSYGSTVDVETGESTSIYRYWVPGGSCLFSDTDNWSLTSGGASGASVPTTGYTAIFDGNSGAGAYTVYIDMEVLCAIDTSASDPFRLRIVENGVLSLQGALSNIKRLDISSTGVFTSNNYNISTHYMTVADTPDVSLGSSTITVGDNANTTAQIYIEAGITIDSDECTVIVYASENDNDFDFAGNTFDEVYIITQSGWLCELYGSNTYNLLSIIGDGTIYMAGTHTVSTTVVLTGSTGGGLILTGDGDVWTISKTSGTVTAENCTLAYSTATGGATFNALTTNGNVDGGDNTGWNFS